MDYQTEISMLDIKTMFLNHQLLRLQIELKKDILDENKISFLRKDINKLQEYINEFKKTKTN
jgi:hypothetical protein